MKKTILLMCLLCMLPLSGCTQQAEVAAVEEIKAVDVDLTTLSSTMVYAEVSNMMYYPEDYVGKVIKVKGPYVASRSTINDQTYHFILIEDATACCAQGLEFIYVGGYPTEGEPAEVTGVFDSYKEDEHTYYYIVANTVTAES